MNNPQKLDELLQFLLETARETKDFTAQQAPDVFRELVLWKAAENLVPGVLLILASASILRSVVRMCKRIGIWGRLFKAGNPEDDESLFGLSVLLSVVALILLTWGVISCFHGLGWLIAPKMHALQWVMEQVR